MGASAGVLIGFTVFWAAIGGVLPFFVPRSANRGIIQTMLVTTAFCCYIMWLCTYMAQMNPLFGPQLRQMTNKLVQRNWGSDLDL